MDSIMRAVSLPSNIMDRRRGLAIALVSAFALGIGMISWQTLPKGGQDMRIYFMPALVNWTRPWQEGAPLLPWAVLVLMPLRLLGARAATALVNAVSALVVAATIRRYRGNVLLSIPIMLSPVGFSLMVNAQVDALVLAGVLLPAGFDLILFWKPQVLLHFFWCRLWPQRKAYLISGSILLLSSIILWGLWPREIWLFAQDRVLPGWWNRSLWPFSIPIGLFLVYLSIKNRDETYGLMASPLLFPYVNGPSYIGLLVAVACKWPRILVGTYLLYLLYALVSVLMPELNLPYLWA